MRLESNIPMGLYLEADKGWTISAIDVTLLIVYDRRWENDL